MAGAADHRPPPTSRPRRSNETSPPQRGNCSMTPQAAVHKKEAINVQYTWHDMGTQAQYSTETLSPYADLRPGTIGHRKKLKFVHTNQQSMQGYSFRKHLGVSKGFATLQRSHPLLIEAWYCSMLRGMSEQRRRADGVCRLAIFF